MNSKSARAELAGAYGLRNNINQSVNTLKNNLNINFSKKIIKQLKKEMPDSFDNMYKRAAIAIALSVLSLSIITIIGFNYLQKSIAEEKTNNNIKNIQQTIEFPDDENYEEFIFDENNEALLTNK